MVDPSPQPAGALLPETLGMTVSLAEAGAAGGSFTVDRRHMAPNGYMHAATAIALADTCCGLGCMSALPAGAIGFTTIELKSNFLGTAKIGDVVSARARLVHGGRTTQVWDAEVRNDTTGKVMTLFRCTQLLIYPKG